MKIGLFAVVLNELPLKEVIGWGREVGFETLELGGWPVEKGGRKFTGTNLDVTKLTKAKADEIAGWFDENRMEISSIGYYDNMLHPDKSHRREKIAHLKKVIDAADMLGTDLVGCFIGRDPSKTIIENLKEVKKVFPSLCKYAQGRGVRLMIENCPMENWQFEGLVGNIAHTPEMWEYIFDILDDHKIGLNFDPSHLYWQGIDYLGTTANFKNRIFHIHAKDTEILYNKYSENGIFGEDWWRHRLPGLGEIDWSRFISVLAEAGYDGALSIEHEDPVWYGELEKKKKGLRLGYKHLKQFVI